MRTTRFVVAVALTAFALTACAPAEPEYAIEEASVTVTPVQIGSFMLHENATVESDEKWHSTTLTVNMTKLDNSISSSLTITVDFGDVRCNSRRPFTVYASHGRGGKLSQGDVGYHELQCSPFTHASAFAELPAGAVR